jgi:hypothetical protein
VPHHPPEDPAPGICAASRRGLPGLSCREAW